MIDVLKNARMRTYALIGLLILVLQALGLWLMGQAALCECGYIKLWEGIVQSSGNSQHLSDWYTFSHVIHGFGFYLLLWLANKKWPMPIGLRLAIAFGLEASWELIENTDFVINRYREATISLDYYGDSILNSISDTLAMALGFVLAWRLPLWSVIALAVIMELFVGYAIRDNLVLNIIMLLWPLEAIKEWQAGG